MQSRQREISLALHQDMVGQVVEVLVEGPAKKGQGQLTGRCRTGQAVIFAGAPELKGGLVQVRVTQGLVHSLKGRLAVLEEGATP